MQNTKNNELATVFLTRLCKVIFAEKNLGQQLVAWETKLLPAEDTAEDPFSSEALEGSEGDREQAHQDIADGQVQDEQVGDIPHMLGTNDHNADKEVAKESKEEDDQVKEAESKLDPQIINEELLFWTELCPFRIWKINGKQSRSVTFRSSSLYVTWTVDGNVSVSFR